MRTLVAAAVAVVVCTPSLLVAQSFERIEAAVAQIRARQIDSAATLLHAIIDSSNKNPAERAQAYMWLGVVSFYSGEDSAVRSSFRNAVEIDPLLSAASLLADLDLNLASQWEGEQTRALCGEDLPAWIPPLGGRHEGTPLNDAARHAVMPDFSSHPLVRYPDGVREAGIQGRVIVRIIVDAKGRTEPKSVRILATPDRGLNDPVIDMVKAARFHPAMLSGAPTRSCSVLTVDFKTKNAH